MKTNNKFVFFSPLNVILHSTDIPLEMRVYLQIWDQGEFSLVLSRVRWKRRMQGWALGPPGSPFDRSWRQLWRKTQGGWGASLFCVSAIFLRLPKNFRVIGSLKFVYLGHLQWFVFYSCPLDFPGLFWFCVPNLAACSFRQSVNKGSLGFLHKCQSMDWPLRKPVMGAVAILLGRKHIPSMMSPAPSSQG